MAVVKTKLGTMPCPCCGHGVMVRMNDAGTLTTACDGCDVSMFAKKGTEAERMWRAKLGAGTVPKEQSQEPAEKVPELAPAAPPKAQPFDPLGFLKAGGKNG